MPLTFSLLHPDNLLKHIKMKKSKIAFLIILAIFKIFQIQANDNHRLIILADMGNEPDEVQQMTHMITCSNELDIEGLIAVTGKYLRPESNEEYRRVTHPELFIEIIDAYSKDLPNLKKHASGWPEPEDLKKVVCSGQKGYGIADIGEGKSSPGSKLIIDVVGKDDPRPVWIVINAGSNTLAQALFDYEKEHTKAEVEAFVAKLRAFENGAQDNAGAWICSKYPKIHWIRSNYQTYAYGGPGGTDGDLTTNLGPHYWHPYDYSSEGQNDWLIENVMTEHGEIGKVYPERRFHAFLNGGVGFMEGGGTIPWMGLVNKGLFDIDQPSWGGWSGRFTIEKVPDFWSRHIDIMVDEQKEAPFYTYREVSDYWVDPQDGKVYSNNYVPVWRWRKAMYNDQICRMDWCTKPFEDANHHPVAVIDGDLSNSIVRINALAGEVISFDASASTDPDGDRLIYKWWIYEEAGTYPGQVLLSGTNQPKTSLIIPTGAGGKQIHLILEVNDENTITSLFDYRRVVIDVEDIIIKQESIQID